MKLLLITLIIFGPITCSADGYYDLPPIEAKLLADYKQVLQCCERSPVCRQVSKELKAKGEVSLLEKQVNLILMKEDLLQIKHDVNLH